MKNLDVNCLWRNHGLKHFLYNVLVINYYSKKYLPVSPTGKIGIVFR